MAANADAPLTRWRIHFSKTAAMRFTSHLDLLRTWERTFRRAGIRLAYKAGFNPRPRLHLASALPLGFTSQGEILDAWLEGGNSPEELRAMLRASLPPGLEITAIQEVEVASPSLPSRVIASDFGAILNQPVPELSSKIRSLLEATELKRQWKDRSYDLRPLIYDLRLEGGDESGRQIIFMRLAAREGATGRPEEVISALGVSPVETHINRLRILLES